MLGLDALGALGAELSFHTNVIRIGGVTIPMKTKPYDIRLGDRVVIGTVLKTRGNQEVRTEIRGSLPGTRGPGPESFVTRFVTWSLEP